MIIGNKNRIFFWNLIERLARETRGKWKVSNLAKYVVGLRKSNFQASKYWYEGSLIKFVIIAPVSATGEVLFNYCYYSLFLRKRWKLHNQKGILIFLNQFHNFTITTSLVETHKKVCVKEKLRINAIFCSIRWIYWNQKLKLKTKNQIFLLLTFQLFYTL